MFVPIGSNSGESYQVQRSLRLRASASAYLSRTPASAGNQSKWSWSGWLKHGSGGGWECLFSAGTSQFFSLSLGVDGTFLFDGMFGASRVGRYTAAAFRDASAHMHVMFVLDTAQAVASDRVKLFVNGISIAFPTASLGSWPGQNTAGGVNGAFIHRIGRRVSDDDMQLDGYLSEVNFIDGQALTPSSFGQIDPVTGQWTAKKYTGTYGTNGFYLDFSDPTSTTTLMLDRSGSGNNWTPNNISLTAGATYDSMLDVPLGGGGMERGNYATWNALNYSTGFGMTDGNMSVDIPNQRGVSATIPCAIDKCWAEVTLGSTGIVGITPASYIHPGADSTFDFGGGYGYITTGNKRIAGVDTAYGASWTGANLIRIEFDRQAGELTFFKDNVSQGTITGISTSVEWVFAAYGSIYTGSPNTATINCGQRPAANSPTAGFKALHTGNLTNVTLIASGSFTGNLSADGPCIWCNGTPETLTINGNAVTWGTHADKLANGFKIRTASSSYNSSGTNTWTATYLSPSSKSAFKYQNAKGNP